MFICQKQKGFLFLSSFLAPRRRFFDCFVYVRFNQPSSRARNLYAHGGKGVKSSDKVEESLLCDLPERNSEGDVLFPTARSAQRNYGIEENKYQLDSST